MEPDEWMDRLSYFLAGMILTAVLALFAVHGG